jgi:cysteinyl-tRNA synthetase
VKPFHIFNSLTRTIEEFLPANPPAVTYYSCGPTVYLPQHLGNMRAFVFVDTLRRALEFNDYQVRHVMNITDVGHLTSDADIGEDKVEKTARAEGKSPLEIADRYIKQFKDDCALLNVELPEPPRLCRATDHIPDMIALIDRILNRGLGYVTGSGVYFDVEKWRGPSGMGRLSRQSLAEQNSGQRLDHSTDKRSQHDFALWVLDQPHHIMQWDSPWGRGYPGWHIECSAMSMKYLGATLDLHSGGLDHIPIHHENEIAQSEAATGQPFVRYFVHNAFLTGMKGAKISKSEGKFPILDDLRTAGIRPLAFRLFCLGAKYRSELVSSDEGLRAAQSNLDYLQEFAHNVAIHAGDRSEPEWTGELREQFHRAINNDLNTPQAVAVALELVRKSYASKELGAWSTLVEFDAVLGLNLEGHRRAALSATLPENIRRLKLQREVARKVKDYTLADELRRELESLGYEVKDNRDGTMAVQARDK